MVYVHFLVISFSEGAEAVAKGRDDIVGVIAGVIGALVLAIIVIVALILYRR